MRALIVAVCLSWATAAEAGPFCWNEVGFAPYDQATLPGSPVIAYAVHDQFYGGLMIKTAKAPTLTATIDGTPVPISWDDVRTDDGIVRYIRIRSTATGKLELWRRFEYGDGKPAVQATYTIVKDWSAGAASLSVAGGKDNNLGPYRWQGDYLGIDVDQPAISFAVKWRARPGDAWHSLVLPAHPLDHRVEGWLGEQVCGMRENIPLAKLAAGIEVELRALLPNGRYVELTRGPTPLSFVPFDRLPKPNRATRPPPPSG